MQLVPRGEIALSEGEVARASVTERVSLPLTREVDARRADGGRDEVCAKQDYPSVGYDDIAVCGARNSLFSLSLGEFRPRHFVTLALSATGGARDLTRHAVLEAKR